jgi:hypothetical protein
MAIREIGIAHLTLLGLTPPELVSTAAEAGYDFVGVRVVAATKGETPYRALGFSVRMAPPSPVSTQLVLTSPTSWADITHPVVSISARP